jgi:acetolactate synthase I/II/III large subunit
MSTSPGSAASARSRKATPPLREGGRVLVDQLAVAGVDRIFGVPGESFLPVLDALCDVNIPFIVTRHEGGAAMMAEAHGKLTGRPGICFVTRGPGATNASAGVHIAHQDSSPMILFIGQVGTSALDREGFQEVEFRLMFAPLAKWVAQIERADRIPEYLSRAFHVATSGRPGPVVLALPEDVLADRVAVHDMLPYAAAQPLAGAAAVAEVRQRLQSARRPMVVVGGGGWHAQASEDLRAFVEANQLPTVASFRCQDYLDNRHPSYVGDLGLGPNPALAERVRGADLLLLAGARMGEASSRGYTLLDIPSPAQTLVHVYPDPEELGRVYRPEQSVVASAPSFFAAARALPPLPAPPWASFTTEARRDYQSWLAPRPHPGSVQLGEVVASLGSALPEDAIITNGAGNYTVWLHRHHQYRRYRTQLGPTSGTMGYGLPAAVSASLHHPDRQVVCFAGDGCFLMHGQELATAVQYGARFVVVVVNNGSLATIRTHQERRYPGRVSATDLRNPDFVALARAYGASGELVTRTEDFPAALGRATAFPGPALIELPLDLEALTSSATLTQIREAALAKKRNENQG